MKQLCLPALGVSAGPEPMRCSAAPSRAGLGAPRGGPFPAALSGQCRNTRPWNHSGHETTAASHTAAPARPSPERFLGRVSAAPGSRTLLSSQGAGHGQKGFTAARCSCAAWGWRAMDSANCPVVLKSSKQSWFVCPLSRGQSQAGVRAPSPRGNPRCSRGRKRCRAAPFSSAVPTVTAGFLQVASCTFLWGILAAVELPLVLPLPLGKHLSSSDNRPRSCKFCQAALVQIGTNSLSLPFLCQHCSSAWKAPCASYPFHLFQSLWHPNTSSGEINSILLSPTRRHLLQI